MLNKTAEIESKIMFDEPMKKHTSFKIGGIADLFIKVSTVDELISTLEYAKEKKIPITIIGNGSNILVLDKGIRGLVIKIDIQNLLINKNINHIVAQKNAEIVKNVEVIVGAGKKTTELGINLMNEGITGFEELSGIPGTIGGAIYMNAGAYGKEMKDIVISTKCMDFDGNIFELQNEDQNFAYRSSIYCEKKYIILETKLKLEYGNKKKIKEKMNQYLEQRKQKQPLEYPSAGSTFKREEGVITAKLIDECGLKGYKIGGAKISEKHAGFIVNDGDATAKDVVELIKYVKEKVYKKYGIKIEEEIKIIGEE